VIVFEGGDDLTEELQGGKGSFFVDFDEIGNFFKQLFEVMLIVVIFYDQTHHVKEQTNFRLR
jgi:hypothetical protein